MDLDALESVLLQNRVKFIFVTPDFHNPTGTTLPLAERRRILEIASHYQVPIIEDAIYARLRLRGTALPSLKALDRAGNRDSNRQFLEDCVSGIARRLVYRAGRC